jgi:hypothetical protein
VSERDDYAEPGSVAHKPSPLWEASLLGLVAVALVLAVVLLIELIQRLDHWISNP